MIIWDWFKKITDIIMPDTDSEEDEAKETKKSEPAKVEEQPKVAAAEKKVETEEPIAQPARQAETVQKQAVGLGSGKVFTRTNSTVSTSESGVTNMNGYRYEAYSSEASVRPSLAVVKTPQITMKIYTPLKYDEQVKSIGQDLIKRNAVLVNYEGVDENAQQRIGDFVLGVVYTISGRVEPITSKIVLYVPEGFEIESAQVAMAAVRRYSN